MNASNLKPDTVDSLQEEILGFIANRKSLQLATINPEGKPFASYAPFAISDNSIYVLLSDIALHAVNLKTNPLASVLIIEDEDSAGELFARIRVNYSMRAEHIDVSDKDNWQIGVETLASRHGERSKNLSELSDFNLFRLIPEGGRYVKGFGKAYNIEGNTLSGAVINHMRDGHVKRESA